MVLLIILWAVFFFLHSLLASTQVKLRAETLLGPHFRFYRLAYNVFSLIFLSGILYLLVFADVDYLFAPTAVSTYAGYALMGLGLLIIVLAFRNYDLGEFSGIRQLAQQIHHPERLMITGLNRYVRNPLYTGIIVFAAGYLLWQPTGMNLATVIVLYVYIYIGTRLEERKLEAVFGEEYRAYKKRVKMLIPFVL
jgi:protein-S-isoprenylcysteine O-methyltransferase Ste14